MIAQLNARSQDRKSDSKIKGHFSKNFNFKAGLYGFFLNNSVFHN